MTISTPEFTRSLAMRRSLARGYARETCRLAREEDADMVGAFRTLGSLAPNRKSAERTIGRLHQGSGVVRAALIAGHKARVLTVLRSAPEVTFPDLAGAAFSEASIIYTWVEASADKGTVRYLLYRVTISPHALQRLVERSSCPLGRGILATVDAEVRPMFRVLRARATEAEMGEDLYVRSEACEGLWVGCLCQSPADDDWGLERKDEGMPTLAIRTFLNVEAMSPANYLRWKGDPTLTVK